MLTRIVLPDGTGRTVAGASHLQVGDSIAAGDVAEWPRLSGYTVYGRHTGRVGRCNYRGEYEGGEGVVILVH